MRAENISINVPEEVHKEIRDKLEHMYELIEKNDIDTMILEIYTLGIINKKKQRNLNKSKKRIYLDFLSNILKDEMYLSVNPKDIKNNEIKKVQVHIKHLPPVFVGFAFTFTKSKNGWRCNPFPATIREVKRRKIITAIGTVFLVIFFVAFQIFLKWIKTR